MRVEYGSGQIVGMAAQAARVRYGYLASEDVRGRIAAALGESETTLWPDVGGVTNDSC